MYDVVLSEKCLLDGLTKDETRKLLSLIEDEEIYPVEIPSSTTESSLMGFITADAADLLDFNYEDSGLAEFLSEILCRTTEENALINLQFKRLRIGLLTA